MLGSSASQAGRVKTKAAMAKGSAGPGLHSRDREGAPHVGDGAARCVCQWGHCHAGWDDAVHGWHWCQPVRHWDDVWQRQRACAVWSCACRWAACQRCRPHKLLNTMSVGTT